MFFLYNILQLVLVLFFFPFIMLFVAASGKYRGRIPSRLGIGLTCRIPAGRPGARRFWLHALSVGEVTSAVPLVTGLRQAYPDSTIIVSVTTATGRKVADKLLGDTADGIVDGPIDLLPVVRRFIGRIAPDLFILVETDFWPNLLHCLKEQGVPTLLVNGRISPASLEKYLRLSFFFRSMFQSFSRLSMQTRSDRDNMLRFGVPEGNLPVIGNLKYATRAVAGNRSQPDIEGMLPAGRLIFLAGSTHPGEELILIRCYIEARKLHPELHLWIAPRDPGRAGEIENIATEHKLKTVRRSVGAYRPADMLLIDSIGELVDFYRRADVAFVGGSLVPKGGHNPIEPAAMGIPVLFGPDMTDFSEIADSLVDAGGAIRVGNLPELTETLVRLLNSPDERRKAGEHARQCVNRQKDIVARHLDLIDTLL